MTMLLGLAGAKQAWFWGVAGAITLAVLVVNVLVLLAVHLLRVRRYFRRRRARAFYARCEGILAELDPHTRVRDPEWLRRELAGFDELQRPIAARMLIERLRPASEEERQLTLEALREVGAIDRMLGQTKQRMPWRRALVISTLGWTGADEAVPAVLARLSDRSRHIRETAVRALGRIGDRRALPQLGELFRSPGKVGPGVVYDALVALGRDAQPVFAGALRSQIDSVRVASCFGVAATSEPAEARDLLEPLLGDPEGAVRAAAAEALSHVGGARVPEALARASRDELAPVRAAATHALAAFDDPRAVELAVNALLDPDRETAVRAGEALVRLSRLGAAGPAAREVLATPDAPWPVERARVFASVGAV